MTSDAVDRSREESGQGGGFEAELRRLEEIVSGLESEEVSLERALELFEEGTGIVKSAREKLETARLKVHRILGEAGDELRFDDFSAGEGDEGDDDGG